MNLPDHAEHALASLTLGAAFPQMLSAEHEGQRLTCELVALESLACAFTHLSVQSDALADASPKRLKDLGELLSRRLSYLLEPISPIEVDTEQCIVQLRSSPPQQGDGQSSYYELLVRKGGEISLRRYAKLKGQPRQISPAQVTREVLLRLVGDVSAVLK
jgi:hypothetical protein